MATATFAAPAVAATPSGSITINAPADLPIAAAGASGRAYIVYADSHGIRHGNVTFDVSQVAKFAKVEVLSPTPGGSGPTDCPASGTRISCSLPDGDSWTTIEVIVEPTGVASGGAHGAVSITAKADNADTTTTTSTVKVVDAPDLAAYTSFTHTNQKPGDKVNIPITVANLGSRDADGLTFTFTLDHGLIPDSYSDCAYATPNKYVTVVTCTTKLNLPAGQLVTLDAGFNATVADDAFGSTNATWVVTAQGDSPPIPQALLSKAQTRSAGHRLSDGAQVGPISKKGTVTTQAAPDVNIIDNSMTAGYMVENTVDIAAVGTTTTAAPGSTINVPVGGKNTGHGSVRMNGPGNPAFKLTFVVPSGTEVVTVPDGCNGEIGPGNYGPGDPGKPSYECYSNDTLYVGETYTVTFGLKVSAALPATGSVSVLSYATDGPDANPSNDKAPVAINVGPPSPSAPPSLPVTGSQTVLIAGAGAAVLAAGAVLFMLARRRRIVLVTPDDHTAA
ncbi:LPXTG cell wall anchor domain-containing protein [Dactylosporangium sp. NPDC049140]|uniref:LPXTG cell wall anchor domain-containing protein n=1 Tax=Dactylosporangium sp. NPDC049140 TaxID=3155647 RepID=UPI0033E875CE